MCMLFASQEDKNSLASKLALAFPLDRRGSRETGETPTVEAKGESLDGIKSVSRETGETPTVEAKGESPDGIKSVSRETGEIPIVEAEEKT